MTDTTEVKLHFLDYWRVIRVRWGIVLLTFLLVVVTAGITTYFLPRQYFSKVQIEVKPDTYKGATAFGRDGLTGGSDAKFAPTQFNVIQAKEILYPVIDNLKLQDKWSGGGRLSKDQVYNRLKRMLAMREVRNTDLIEIGIYSTDADEAAELANTIANTYMERRQALTNRLTNTGLYLVQEQIAKNTKEVDKLRDSMMEIANKEGITDINFETTDITTTPETQQVLNDKQELSKTQSELQELTVKLDKMRLMKGDELVVGLSQFGEVDPTILKVYPDYQTSLTERAGLLKSGLGQKHPRVSTLDAKIKTLREQLENAVVALRQSLEYKLEIRQKTMSDLQARVTRNQEDFRKERQNSGTYNVAKSKYIQAKRVLEQMTLGSVTQTIENILPFQPALMWEKAEPSLFPAKPNVPAYMALAVLVGLIVGVALAFFIEYLDTSVKTLEDVEKFLGIPVLAVIPRGIHLLYRERGDSPDAEAYRILRTNLEFSRKNPDANTITCISGGPGEGKSTTLFNLACTCAKGGYNVLIVDADVRRPSQHRMFDMDNSVGLTNYLLGNVPFEECIRNTDVENLSFVPSGILPSESVGILNSQRMSDLIARVKRQYDLVFFDSPPILGVSDGSVLASEVDMTVMVVQHRRFPRSMLQRVKQAVLNVGGTLVGVVLNNVNTAQDGGYNYYTSYYDYYTPQPEQDRARKSSSKPAPAASTARSIREGDNY